MLLTNLFDAYRLERGIRTVTASRMLRSISVFSEYLEHAATTTDLTRNQVNSWLCWMVEKYKAKTAREFRGDICAVWRFAADADYCDYPARIRVIRIDRPIPEAWTPDEARRLLAACLRVKHGMYLRLLLTIVYETGLRRGDALKLTSDDVDSNGCIRCLQHKTSNGHAVRLSRQTADLLRARGDMIPPVNIRRVYRLIERVCQLANVRNGAMQKMRRTGATQVERAQPGAATKYLGHKTASLAWQYYIDRTQLTEPTTPPPLN